MSDFPDPKRLSSIDRIHLFWKRLSFETSCSRRVLGARNADLFLGRRAGIEMGPELVSEFRGEPSPERGSPF
jgi:hypothetical protein